MSVYAVTVSYNSTASSSVRVLVEADSEEEAKEKGQEKVDQKWQEVAPTLCAHCSGWGQVWNMDLGEWEPDTDEYGTTVERQPDGTVIDDDE